MKLLGINSINLHIKCARALTYGIEHEVEKDVAEVNVVQQLARGAVGDLGIVLAAASFGDDLSTGEGATVALAAQRAVEEAVYEALSQIRDWREGEQ